MRIIDNKDLGMIPRRNQTQATLNDQLHDLIFVAQKLGFYDAADFLKDRVIDIIR